MLEHIERDWEHEPVAPSERTLLRLVRALHREIVSLGALVSKQALDVRACESPGADTQAEEPSGSFRISDEPLNNPRMCSHRNLQMKSLNLGHTGVLTEVALNCRDCGEYLNFTREASPEASPEVPDEKRAVGPQTRPGRQIMRCWKTVSPDHAPHNWDALDATDNSIHEFYCIGWEHMDMARQEAMGFQGDGR